MVGFKMELSLKDQHVAEIFMLSLKTLSVENPRYFSTKPKRFAFSFFPKFIGYHIDT